MHASGLLSTLEVSAGIALLLFIFLDFFLTVLYARIGSGILSFHIASLTWRAFRFTGRWLGRAGPLWLSFCGPVILVLLVLAWGAGLTLGTALVFHPQLGEGIRATEGNTPTDFITALFAAASSVDIVTAGDFAPKTRFFRAWFIINSLSGMSVMFLTTTYVLQVYTALLNRNTFALKIHLGTRETGDAAELIAGLGPRGRFDQGFSTLSEMAGEMTHVKESHHFYPVVFYFRFREPFYAVSAFSLVTMDAMTLVRTVLDDGEYIWLKESGPVDQLFRSADILVQSLNKSFVPPRGRGAPPADPGNEAGWRDRYLRAHERIRAAGAAVVTDVEAGAGRYIELRRHWDPPVCALARHGGYAPQEIDSASQKR